jgi:hypothetical protein
VRRRLVKLGLMMTISKGKQLMKNMNTTNLVNTTVANRARFIFSSQKVEQAVSEVIARVYNVCITTTTNAKAKVEHHAKLVVEQAKAKQAKARINNTVAKLKKEVIARIEQLRKAKSIGAAIQTANKVDAMIASIKEVITINGGKKTVRLGFYDKQELFNSVNLAFGQAQRVK